MKNNENTIIDIDTLIPKLQSQDVKNLKLTRVMQFIFAIIIVAYTIFLIVNPESESGVNQLIAGAFCIPGLLLFLIYFSYYSNKYKRVNYSDSVKNVLKSAEIRFRFWQPSFYMVFAAILLVAIGVGIIITHNFELLSLAIIYGVSLLIGFVSGFYMGFKNWEGDSKPLWLATQKLLEELNEPN